MNRTEIFTLALGLKEPWFIYNVEILTNDNSVKELHIHFGFTRGSKFEDEKGESCPVHDTQDKTWRHLNFFEHTCLLHCSVPRIRTSEGKVRLIWRSAALLSIYMFPSSIYRVRLSHWLIV